MDTASLDAIGALTAQLKDLTDQLQSDPSTIEQTKESIAACAEKLAIEARGPHVNLFWMATGPCRASAISCGIELGVFDDPDKGVSVSEVAKANAADEKLVARILRVLGTTYVLDPTGVDQYASTACSRALSTPVDRAIFQSIFNLGTPTFAALPSQLSTTGWREPDSTRVPFKIVHGMDFWPFVNSDRTRQQLFAKGMQAQGQVQTADNDVRAYPFGDLIRNTAEDDTVLVDVGGNGGYHLGRIRRAFPSLATAKCAVQDLPGVLPSKAPPNTQLIDSSFFEPQPVRGARAYMLRRILHDWDDEKCLAILKNIVDAMGVDSRVLIAENLVPEQGVHWTNALEDFRMMVYVAGKERTRTQWRALLSRAGLKGVKFWEAEKGYFGVVEAWKGG